ncbi:MAG: two-component system, LuxR family, sensor kinase FixL [Porphyrobacter sp. HL-46]|nr:MAG: two-component system, LuxR family, sensor kinase FixL [Porphyrobacter sp. HL-46]
MEALAQTARHSLLPTILTDSLIAGNQVVFANDAFLAMAGLDREAILGRPIIQLIGEQADAYGFSLFEAALTCGRSGLCQMQLPREGRGVFPVVVYLSAVRDPGGRTIGHNITFVDPTALLCMSHERDSIYSKVYDNAPGFIAIAKGEDHRFEYANASYKDFVKRDDLIGKTVAEAMPEIADDGFLKILDQVYRTGIPFRASDCPISIRDPATGHLRQCWIDVLYQPVRDESGAITGLFCEGHDVTDRHEMNEAIAALEMKMIHSSRVNAMGTMAAALAHELNQPLTAITNYLAGIRPVDGQTPDVERLIGAMEGIKESAERAAGIINHLRQLTKHRKPSRQPFNLREAVDECVRLVKTSCRPEIIFDNRVAKSATMNADRVKIQQVLINLMQNACDAMMETACPQVLIDSIVDDHGLTVCVADTGPGVSPEAFATMFAWTETSKDDGMGIGLSICRTIVELYGGSIWLEMSGPEGTEFRFFIPWPELSPLGENADPAPSG